MDRLKEIEVWFSDKVKIGTIKINSQRPYNTAFRYDNQWLKNGFSISPFSLPLEDKEFIPNPFIFDGVFGVFADSLPDGWGRLLVDRMLRSNGKNPSLKEILEVAKKANLDMNYAEKTALDIEKIVYEDLKEYLVENKSKTRLRTRY